ncbi:MAG: hypothetical protein DRP62_06435 [Planctomycetota bacterium]|nr:MAG: hypothetical protein DRP62_06435 [Planctomycetota bacterium]
MSIRVKLEENARPPDEHTANVKHIKGCDNSTEKLDLVDLAMGQQFDKQDECGIIVFGNWLGAKIILR